MDVSSSSRHFRILPRNTTFQALIDNVHDIVDKFNAQDIVDKRSLTME